MQFFNKNFFRLAFGFIGIIVFSMILIFIVSELKSRRNMESCGEKCANMHTP